ncbi:MAG: D-alanyl-D-alanine carboxypeptidase [Alphaproteobacteria bacterium]|nr:serine hydrolase [Alphaproteobacteria bacterium]MDE2110755.1 D-alanyl-D-alanine carboxypeptidase [Alphaproteobacteria bacterium]MDE2494560.1 D-alanyl-D-alanine carboxypeptidase [Alphaproteobacteria bacterium]
MGPLAILALIVALGAVVSSPAEARHYHHRHYAIPASLTDPAKDAALIVDGETGKVLYARNADAERHPASLTKLMTLYMLFDALKKGQMTMATPLTFSAHAAHQAATNLRVSPGETIPVETAIKAIVVHSANDVAVAIAESIGGTEAHFAELMNAKARALGMHDTFYHNASGLPDRLQITTARDLAVLARHLAYDFPQYFHFFATEDFVYHGYHYAGYDNVLKHYPGADGMKTGYTAASGFNLVTSVVRNGSQIIGVVMGGRTAPRRDKEMMALLDDTFEKIAQNPTLVAHGSVPWQTTAVAMNTMTPLPPNVLPAPSPTVVADNGVEDEETAETRTDGDYVDNTVVTPAPRPAQIQNAMVASYQPEAKHVVPKPILRPEVQTGEGDVGDNGIALASLGVHDWTIQIGAFTDIDQARAQLASYAEKSMDVLGQAQRIVVPFQSIDGHLLYRARFGPFLEREARQVCERLTERGQTCFAAIATR